MSATAAPRGSLRAKIIGWSFTPTAIILAVVAMLIYYSYQRVTEDLVVERDRQLVRLQAAQLAASLGQYAAILQAVARSPEMYGEISAAKQQAVERASNQLAVFDAGVVALDGLGRVIAAQPQRPEILSQDWSDRDYFRRVLRSQAPAYSDVVRDGPNEVSVVVFAVPITGFRGEFMGALVGMFRVAESSVSAFYGSLIKLRPSQSGNTYLVDGTGVVIHHSEPSQIGTSLMERPEVQQVLAGQAGNYRSRDARGLSLLSAYAPIPDTNWGLVVEESWATLMGPSANYQRFLLFLVALGVVLPGLVVVFGVRRITQPINDLIEAAAQVASGRFGYRIVARTNDEVEALAEQFNRMSAELKSSYAQLERRVSDRTRELAAVNAITAVVSQSLDLEEILEAAVLKCVELMAMDSGIAYELGEDGELALVAHQGLSQEMLALLGQGAAPGGVASQAIEELRPVVRGLSDFPEQPIREQLERDGVLQLVGIPLVARGKPMGAINLGTGAPRIYAADELDLLSAIGQQVGVAVENARLYRRAEQAAAAAERSRLARELHDAVTQTLFSASLIAEVLPRLWQRDPPEAARRLEELRQLTRGALAEMRTLLLELRPSALLDAQLGELLRQLAEAFTGRARIPVTVSLVGEIAPTPEVKVALYRIAQEALNNVAKHAEATQVQLTLRAREGQMELRIVDDGRGFDLAAVPPTHLGLGIMEERALSIHAELIVDSELGEGTEIVVRWTGDRSA